MIINLIFGILIIAMYVTWGFILPLILLYLYYVYNLSKQFFKPNDFVKRLRMKCESIVASYFLETLHGLTVIRGFGKSDEFRDNFYEKV